MISLRGANANTPKEPKRNFIKENVQQLRNLQNSRQALNKPSARRKEKVRNKNKVTASVTTSESLDKTNRLSNSIPKSESSSQQYARIPKSSETPSIRRADMGEFMKRKLARESRVFSPQVEEYFKPSTDNLSRNKDVGCQYIEPDATHFFADGTKLRVIYPSTKILDTLDKKSHIQVPTNSSAMDESSKLITQKKEAGSKIVRSRYLSSNSKISRDEDSHRSSVSLCSSIKLDTNIPLLQERTKSYPLLPPPSYQKGVVPKYIKDMKQKPEPIQMSERKQASDPSGEGDSQCPPGHIALPEAERVDTLKILREKFSDLVGELNRMPIRSDTLRMKNRKMQLDKELGKLEEGIKVFSRSKVYVNIDI